MYIVFFTKVRSTIPWLRWLAVTITALAMISLLTTVVGVFILFWRWKTAHNDNARGGDISLLEMPPRHMSPQPPEDLEGARSPGEASIPSPQHPSAPFQLISRRTDLTSILPQEFSTNKSGALTRGLATIYGIIMLERTVASNDVGPGENVWSFGQIVSIIIAVGSVNEVVHFCLQLKGYKHSDFTIEEYLKG